ncbi:MAG TPA: phosphoadenosine phosphosulfate reductase family protein [candidate division Zixibacteria bacterium]|jgi:3'-phosphoadenosine 5'-phosphosulfate sulfotransferase (PAPS reductase)/FAD synthetase
MVDPIPNNQWWRPIEEAFAEVSLKGLKTICPRCKEKGLVITRWIKGPALKPIYIFHIKWRKVRKVCELSEEQSKNIRGKVSIFKSDIRKLLETKKSFVLFSGGKDSLATLAYLKDIAKTANNYLTALYVDTTAGLPENTKYVKKVCKYLKINLKVVKPKVDYFTLAKEWGIPSFGYRWCCRELKIKPIEEYLDSIKEPKVVFDGIRAVESNVRKQYIPIWYHPSFKCLSVSPIFYWSDIQVTSLINSNGLPKTLLHSLGSSTECWCGAYKTETDFKKLYGLNRDMFYKLVELEEGNKSGFTFIYKNGQRIPLRDLEKQILNERM